MYQKVVCALVAKHARPILTMSTNAVRVGLLVENGETRLASLSERAKPTWAARRAPETKIIYKSEKCKIRCSETKFLSKSCQNHAIFAFCYFYVFSIFSKTTIVAPVSTHAYDHTYFWRNSKFVRFLTKNCDFESNFVVFDAILTKIEL